MYIIPVLWELFKLSLSWTIGESLRFIGSHVIICNKACVVKKCFLMKIEFTTFVNFNVERCLGIYYYSPTLFDICYIEFSICVCVCVCVCVCNPFAYINKKTDILSKIIIWNMLHHLHFLTIGFLISFWENKPSAQVESSFFHSPTCKISMILLVLYRLKLVPNEKFPEIKCNKYQEKDLSYYSQICNLEA